jgi:hypothetical protein
LMIDVEKVERVMLVGGQWCEVKRGTFTLDSYEYVEYSGPPVGKRHWNDDHLLMHGGGNSGVCATGFQFKELHGLGTVSGPLTAIMAVRELP